MKRQKYKKNLVDLMYCLVKMNEKKNREVLTNFKSKNMPLKL